ncbi:alpha/beta hydrolase [Veronia nyctiphanis]|uniref:Alpha/beta hydrolase n=1 Tax=Veronia nyctiphanis TaxID=1278244 RepID=A0A4Q0YYA5_9GAMM|nr:alpha/beta hydrolase [Veronia nyctiphanis]RXJ74199.1 alpha/beta hydrolase [Veronia nyctiphanis]
MSAQNASQLTLNKSADLGIENLLRIEFELADGTVIRGHRTEPSGKPVIHFLHGTGLSGLTYWPMLRLLSNEFDLFIPDIQGHGDSDDGGKFWGWNRNAEVCREIWSHFSTEYRGCEVIGMGHSFGGVLTVLMQDQDKQLFDRLVLLDPVVFSPIVLALLKASAFFGLPSPNPLVKATLNRRNSWPSKEEAERYFTGRGALKYWSPVAISAYVENGLTDASDGGVTLKCSPQRESEIFGSTPDRLWASLRGLGVPTSILFGENTYWFSRISFKILNKKPSIFKVEALEGGHCFMQEKPDDAVKSIKAHTLKAL